LPEVLGETVAMLPGPAGAPVPGSPAPRSARECGVELLGRRIGVVLAGFAQQAALIDRVQQLGQLGVGQLIQPVSERATGLPANW
jgi:hypothetical protein